MENNFNNIIKEKADSFVNFIKSIVVDNKKDMIDKEIDELKNNQLKLFLFIATISEKNIDKHIKQFMDKFSICDKHYDKIKQFYECFLDLQKLLLSK